MNVVSSVLRRNSWIGNKYLKILQRVWKKDFTVAGSQFHVATRRLCADNNFHLIKFSREMRYQIHNKKFRLLDPGLSWDFNDKTVLYILKPVNKWWICKGTPKFDTWGRHPLLLVALLISLETRIYKNLFSLICELRDGRVNLAH